tara:strand:- start:437 stop:694 length:258 start_codon:yes stop_codon:yes gene_type:complete
MDRLSNGQLVARCADAWDAIPVFSLWKHRNGTIYEAKGVALTSDSLTPVVIYQQQRPSDGSPAFTREASEFLDGRFVRLKDKEGE